MNNDPATKFSKRPSRVEGVAQPVDPSAAGVSVSAGWQLPPPALCLANNEVHVWRASLECHPSRVSQFAACLSEDERLRANRFRFELDRNRFIAGRGTLRAILGRYLGIAAGAVQFCYSTAGKPGLAPVLRGDLHFNVTHSNALALYAVSRSEVGIDVEYVRDISGAEEIAGRFFTSQESAELATVPRAKRMETFLRAWTRKEAGWKARGVGIAAAESQWQIPLDDAAASLGGGAVNVVESRDWRLHDLTPASGYVAALVSRGPARELSCFHPG